MKSMIVLALALAVPVLAQNKPAPKASEPVASTTERLSTTETIALQQLAQEFAMIQQKVLAVESDVQKNHSGFHLNTANPFDGKLYEDEKPKPKENKK